MTDAPQGIPRPDPVGFEYPCDRCGHKYMRSHPDKSPLLCVRCTRWLAKIFYRAAEQAKDIQPPISRPNIPEI